ncbi:MAG: ATP-dependent protease LonB [Candidatus Altiarchaeales archaeon]|nr:MAG: ATP-dependent protease LonB [Candidatus Altiarchaeales archaeon]RLI94095.1 MAG: ATP-dependent protease LonB [Candidatus Altiarchaeales archaeon]RLI95056.1 MAG: ATP-dependent protease LonB [Candidatus Altiarchaeales archaeon]
MGRSIFEIQKSKRDVAKGKKRREEKKISVDEMKSWDDFETTDQIEVPKRLIDQVIGQDRAVDIIKKAAKQRRNVLLIGEPGTGKSMLAMAMAELLPAESLVDILVYPNLEDENNPKIRVVPAGEGMKIVKKEREKLGEAPERKGNQLLLPFMIITTALILHIAGLIDGIVTATLMGFGILLFFLFGLNLRLMMMGTQRSNVPKLIVDNSSRKRAPFYDGTGAHAGALLGDVKHDPLQSGGLGTPPHLRVVPGLIHKANKGVLFIDEIATLGKSQQDLLTALQEKKLPITGRSEMSSGAMVMTDPVPCDFILVASGNIDVIQHMHPALRSRIRGYGYEVYMNDIIDDSEEIRKKLVQFVAQEVEKDGKIPHFTRDAVGEIIREAKRKAGMKNKITLRFRELGGLVRAAGDIAKERGHKYVTAEDVLEGKKTSRTLERQISDIYLERKREYNVLVTKGGRIGRVNGLAVLGEGGIVLPIEAEVAPGGKKSEIIATGKLGEIAKEAIQNVSAVIMKVFGEDIKEKYDIFVQFLQTYEGVEGDSASVSVAVAIISALKNIKVDQSVAMTGSLTVRGEVLPVGGIIQKIEAAADARLKKIIIPKSNEKDVLLEKKYEDKIEIVAAETLVDVLKNSLMGGDEIIREFEKLVESSF